MVGRRTVQLASDVRLTARFAAARAPALGVGKPLRRAALALALGAAWLGSSTIAHAELDLEWDAPRGCPQRGEVLERIRAIAGSALDEAEGLSAAGKITSGRGGVRLELLVRDGGELRRRVIDSDSCSALAGAAAVTLALLLGVGAGSEAPPEDEVPNAEGGPREAAEPSSTEPGRAVPREPAPSAGSSAPRSWALVLRGPLLSADLGPLPRPALGVGLGIGVRHAGWAITLTGQLSRDQTFSVPEPGATFGAELERVSAQLLACRGWRWTRIEVAPCAGLALERVTAQGFGEGVSPQPQRAIWPAPGAGVVAHWFALPSLALFAAVNGFLELSRPRVVVEELGEVRQLGPAAIGTAVGLEWIL